MLVPMRAILEAADKYRYGHAAFNMNSVGQIEAAVRVHELLRSGAITIPLLLILVPMIGVTGVQIAQPAADVISGLVSIPFIISFVKKHPNE